MEFRRALVVTSFWFFVACVFAGGVFYYMGADQAAEFITGYVIELSLSMDNLFLFLMLFSCFRVDCAYRQRVLTYGIAGAVVMRLIFILLGLEIVNEFHWVLYIFGGILIFTAFKMIFGQESEVNWQDNWMLILFKKVVPITEEFHGERFFTRIDGVLHATPLFVVLLIIESTDLLFAIDSVPAVFAITTDPFIVYSSNVLAIMGLRSLYFFLERMQQAFVFVKYGVALILLITGIKMIVTMWGIKVPVLLALGLILIILVGSVVVSLMFGQKYQAITPCIVGKDEALK